MSIKIIKEPDVHVTEGELQRYIEQYNKDFMYYCGPRPTVEEYIRRKLKEKSNENRNSAKNSC